MTQEEFDNLDESRKFMRGIKDFVDTPAGELIEQYKTGEHYIGRGLFGHGTYSAVMTEENRDIVWSRYAKHQDNNIMYLTHTDDAKVIDNKELGEIKKELQIDIKLSDLDDDTKALLLAITTNRSNVAIMLGYDASHVQGQEYYVLLNRGKVSVVND